MRVASRIGVVLAALMVGWLGCAGGARAQSAPAPARKITLLQYNVVPDLGDAALWIIPHAMGYFADEGLDVTCQLAGGAAGAVQLLAAGRGDIATTIPDQLMIAVQKGVKIKSFFENNRTYGSALVVPTTSGVTTVEQLKAYLKGSAIGVGSLASGRINYARAWMRDLGLTEGTDIGIIPVGGAAQATAALQSNRVRALSIYDAVYANIETHSDIRFTRFETKWQAPLFSGVIVATDATIAKDPEMLAHYGRAIAKSLVFATTNPEAVVRIFWALYPENRPKADDEAKQMIADAAVVKSMVPNFLAGITGNNWGAQSTEDWERVQQFNFDAKVITATVPVDSYFTNQFAAQFNQFDQDAIRKQARDFTPAMIKSTAPN
jgi:NitT/TauT family transport system substrate-binding protein